LIILLGQLNASIMKGKTSIAILILEQKKEELSLLM